MQLKTKKLLTNIATWLFCLFGGIEYAVIIPTLNLFLEDLGAEQFFLGVILSAFSLSGLFFAPLFGIWQDKTSKTKRLILFANMFEIVGNFIYFVGKNEYYLLAGRLIAGIGGSVGSTIFSQISRTTTVQKRTAAISLAMAARQFGLLFGPGFNLFLANLHFNIGPFEVNAFTSPGLFMSIMWTGLQVIIFFMYFDLPLVGDEEHSEETPASTDSTVAPHPLPKSNDQTDCSKVNRTFENTPKSTYGSYKECDTAQQLSKPDGSRDSESNDTTNIAYGSYKRWRGVLNDDDNQKSQYGSINVNNVDDEDQDDTLDGSSIPLIKKVDYTNLTFLQKLNELLKEEIVVVLFIQFVFLFNQTALEASLTPLTEKYLSFGELENSLMFCFAGVEVIAGFFFVRWLSKRCLDRMLSLIGLLVEILPLIMLLYFLPKARQDDRDSNIIWMLICMFLQVFGLPFLAVASVSSFSKMTPANIQGFGHGIRRSVCNIAMIMGPLWSGGSVSKPYVLLSVLMAILILCTAMTLLSWGRLKTQEDKKMPSLRPAAKSCQFEDEETEPLLSTEGVDA